MLAADARSVRHRWVMRKLIVAVSLGAALSTISLWSGGEQPGRWLAEAIGSSGRPYDVYIHDHYIVVKPIVVLLNFLCFTVVALGVVWLKRLHRSGGGEGGGAGA